MAELSDLQGRRVETVRRHMESETQLDLDATLDTFAHPRDELVATSDIGRRGRGPGLLRPLASDLEDQRYELVTLRHSDDSFTVEFDLLGTQRGELMGFPATGKSFRGRLIATPLFEGKDLVCKRVSFDCLTILGQLGHLPS